MASLYFDVEKRPQDETEYVKWMEAKFGVRNECEKTNYESNASLLVSSFRSCAFWEAVNSQLREWDAEYLAKTGVHLFSKIEMPAIVSKPYDSLINKVYRKNCLRNPAFPGEPDGGWISPRNWYEKIHDIVRTSFEVKYLDGVKFLEQKLMQLSDSIGCEYKSTYEAHDDGYYAAHAAIDLDVEIVELNWVREIRKVEFEIQITTELQEMVKGLLHKYYEDNRRKNIPQDYKWQWDYQNEQFVPNYLGHIAHYLEGIIVEIRDKQK